MSSGPEFFQTRMGQKFYGADVPRMIDALERIAKALESSKENLHDTGFRTTVEEKAIEAAQRIYHEEGKIEVDDLAKVSRTVGNPCNGAYVQAWVWVDDSDLVD